MARDNLEAEAADTIDRLFEAAFGERNLSAGEMRDALAVADELRECGPKYNLPERGQTVYDSDKTGPAMEVARTYHARADNFKVGGESVAEANPNHPADAWVVAGTYPDSNEPYHFPVTRLDW